MICPDSAGVLHPGIVALLKLQFEPHAKGKPPGGGVSNEGFTTGITEAERPVAESRRPLIRIAAQLVLMSALYLD